MAPKSRAPRWQGLEYQNIMTRTTRIRIRIKRHQRRAPRFGSLQIQRTKMMRAAPNYEHHDAAKSQASIYTANASKKGVQLPLLRRKTELRSDGNIKNKGLYSAIVTRPRALTRAASEELTVCNNEPPRNFGRCLGSHAVPDVAAA